MSERNTPGGFWDKAAEQPGEPTPEASGGGENCDQPECENPAKYNCYQCGKNLCEDCAPDHDRSDDE
jgi:hypothetical protein